MATGEIIIIIFLTCQLFNSCSIYFALLMRCAGASHATRQQARLPHRGIHRKVHGCLQTMVHGEFLVQPADSFSLKCGVRRSVLSRVCAQESERETSRTTARGCCRCANRRRVNTECHWDTPCGLWTMSWHAVRGMVEFRADWCFKFKRMLMFGSAISRCGRG